MRHLCLLACLAFAPIAAADDQSREEAAAADKLCADELSRWQLSVGGTALDNPKEPVPRWTHPSAGRVYGNTYLWLHQGRPAVVGSMYRYFEPFQTFDGE